VNTSVPNLQLTHSHTHTHTLQADKTLCETGDKIGFWYCSCSDSMKPNPHHTHQQMMSSRRHSSTEAARWCLA